MQNVVAFFNKINCSVNHLLILLSKKKSIYELDFTKPSCKNLKRGKPAAHTGCSFVRGEGEKKQGIWNENFHTQATFLIFFSPRAIYNPSGFCTARVWCNESGYPRNKMWNSLSSDCCFLVVWVYLGVLSGGMAPALPKPCVWSSHRFEVDRRPVTFFMTST